LAGIVLEKITKRFGKDTVIENLDLSIKDGSFTVLVGPSGCGKSTTLRMIAGIENQNSGKIYIGDQDVTNIAPGKRGIAMVFQNYALYPTMSVRDNIEFGLKNKKVAKEERAKLTAEISEIVGLTNYLDRKPSTLSGGQRQRVALARAMVKKPVVFLMDEPLSNLDAKLRAQMRVELIQLHKRLKTTFVYVTHDQVEAMSMGDAIVLMHNGAIMQESTAKEIYHNPRNVYTAQFIGTPPMNIIKGDPNSRFRLGFRAEKAVLSTVKTDQPLQIEGKITTKEMLGAETVYQVQTKYGPVMVKTDDESFEDDLAVIISLTEDRLYFFDENGDRIFKNDSRYAECLKWKG
jgi:sn-glycerol 3-phosphate transport system ATP-binding protein